jgi:dihydrofolate reductase
MRQLTSIVAVNRDGVIGCRNSLPWRVKSDLAFFRSQTSGNVVLMGRRTFDSLGKCLPGRYNIVLSKNFDLFPDDGSCVLRCGIADGLAAVESAPKTYERAFIIGGSTMYEQFDSLIDRYLITVIDKQVDDGDAFFDISVLDRTDLWDVRRVAARTQGDGDEVAFEVFELLARDQVQRVKERQALLSRAFKPLARSSAKRGSSSQSQAVALSFDW